MNKEKPYQPSEKEIKKAEEMMTQKQKEGNEEKIMKDMENEHLSGAFSELLGRRLTTEEIRQIMGELQIDHKYPIKNTIFVLRLDRLK